MTTKLYFERRSIRLFGYDYSQAGLYFVTICVQDRMCLFGDIRVGEMVLNDVGMIVEKCWLDIPNHFPSVKLHEYIVMPNHIHGVLEITDNVGAKNFSPENETLFRSPSKTIGSVVRGFKIGVTKWYNEYCSRANNHSPLPVGKSIWQRNYYEHIIRNEEDYCNIAGYIANNPYSWSSDNYYINYSL